MDLVLLYWPNRLSCRRLRDPLCRTMTSAGVECDRRNRGGADDDESYGRQRNEMMVGTKDQEGSFWPLSGTKGDISSRRERQAHCNDPYDRTPRHDADATSKKCALFCSRMRWTAVATVLVSYSSAHKSAFQCPLRLWRPDMVSRCRLCAFSSCCSCSFSHS